MWETDLLIPDGNGGFTAQGEVASALASGLTVNNLRTLDVLRKEEWIQFDTTVVQVARDRLNGVADLLNAGLRIPINNPLGTTVFQWEDMSDMTPADVHMDGVSRGQQDRVTFALNQIPLPIIHKDFFVSRRVLEASRRLGEPLDTTQAATAARLVSERAEDILFNGYSALSFGGGVLRGYTDHPDRNTITLTQNWDASGKTGEEILKDVLDMLAAAHASRMFGPYMLYVPTAYWTILQDDFKANSDRTILERIRAVASIIDVKPADVLAANNVVLVQMQRDTIAMIDALQPTVVQWESEGGMLIHFKVMAILVPRIASDHENRNGIVHLS